jgi:U3 small nucleolar RNA-associated protein 6
LDATLLITLLAATTSTSCTPQSYVIGEEELWNIRNAGVHPSRASHSQQLKTQQKNSGQLLFAFHGFISSANDPTSSNPVVSNPSPTIESNTPHKFDIHNSAMTNNSTDAASLLLLHMDEDGIVDLSGYHQLQDGGTKKRKRTSCDTTKLTAVPQIGCIPADSSLLQEVYSSFYILHIKSPEIEENKMTWKSFQSIFASLDKIDQDSWCIETKGDKDYTPDEFLQPKVTQDRGYCSFLVQKQKLEGKMLPLEHLAKEWSQGDCTWIFFGRNVGGGKGGDGTSVEGRPEHTDAVSHDGTWHYQLSGRKTWYLRPTLELMELVRKRSSLESPATMDPALVLEVNCQEGDVLIVNTRLWWHRTQIPPQHVPSVSYARDFFFSQEKREQTLMSNVDGMYAVTDIEEGTIVLREEDVPDCELHRSKDNPNCQVVMLEDEDVYAVVSIRPIKAGEFFCVAESDDDDDDDDGADGDSEDGYDYDDDEDGEGLGSGRE